MGSFIHAKSVAKNKDKINGVYILEMIGYFDPESDSRLSRLV